MRRAFPLLVALLLQAPAMAQQEIGYVTDNLRLGIHQAADTSDRAFRTLESGQSMEVISRNRNYANVRLPDGVSPRRRPRLHHSSNNSKQASRRHRPAQHR